jgi:Tol biopolymer transport system component
MRTQATTQRIDMRAGKGVRLLVLVLGAVLAALVATIGLTEREAQAAFTEKMVFSSDRTTGTGVDNPTGDYEVFKMNVDGTGLRQLTFNEVDDWNPALSPDGSKIAYESNGIQNSNPEGDYEIYSMNATDGKGKKNLSNNEDLVDDYEPAFSPGGKRIAYTSSGIQDSNPTDDEDVYVMNALDGSGKKNLSNNGLEVGTNYPIDDFSPDFSPDGTKIAYTSLGKQSSNPEGDDEVYRMSALDGSGKKNLSNNGVDVDDYLADFSPDGRRIAYESDGVQNSNPEGDEEVYVMSAFDGLGKKNLSNNGLEVGTNYPIDDEFPHFSPGGKRIAYESNGIQNSNPQGDNEIYAMNSLDGTNKKNLTNNGAGVDDYYASLSPDGTRFSYTSYGKQNSNPQGDEEIYRMSALDGKGKKNLTNNASNDLDSDWGVQAR